MSFGKMNAFIEIEQAAAVVKDADGFAATVYTTVASVRAYREDKHGSERWANMAAFATANALFRFRAIPDLTVTTAHSIRHGAERFRLLSVENVRGRGMYIEAVAEKEGASVG
jgi:head-tail adaptor